MTTVADRFWIWGHEAGSHNWITTPSRMTPAEGAFYLGVPNIVMVRFGNKPEPPYDTYARSFCPLKQVVWSIIGDASCTLNNNAPDTDEIVSLAKKFPNITGVIMDDMSPDRLSTGQLSVIRNRLRNLPQPLDVWIVLYTHNLDPALTPYVAQSDVVTIWTWQQENLVNLPANLERIEAYAPGKRKVLGCYMYDYGNNKPMLVENMQRQCELGLRWLKEKRIEGMIFLASCICDMDLPAVEWTRRWIREVGNATLGCSRLAEPHSSAG